MKQHRDNNYFKRDVKFGRKKRLILTKQAIGRFFTVNTITFGVGCRV